MTRGHPYKNTRSPRSSTLPLHLTLALAVILLSAAPAVAQEGAIGGVVVSAETEEPIAGAQIVQEGTARGTLAGQDGRFLLRGLSGDEVTIRVSMLGFGSATRTVRVGDMAVRIALRRSAIELDRIVVTGTAGGSQRRAIGNVVSTIDAAEVAEKAPVTSVNEVLNGRVAGVTVLSSTGQVGGAGRVRIRGSSTFSLSNAPLVYIDGIRVNNDEATGPIAQGFGSQSISRWNDIDPDDIESIEVIKGPAAATLYGTEAANGVVQIITKKGAQGAPRFTARISQGANWFQNPEGRLWENWGMVDGELQSITFSDLQDNWPDTDFFRTGHQQTYDVSVGGGSELIRYYLSGSYKDHEGVEPTNEMKQGGARLNLAVTPSPDWQIDGNFGYTAGRTDLACEAGCGGVTWTTYLATPTRLADPLRRGLWSGSAESYHELFWIWQDVRRFTGSVQVNNQITDWFSHRLTVGIDQTREDNTDLMNRDDRFVGYDSFADRGYIDVVSREVNYATVDYSGTARFDLREGLRLETSAGGQYYRNHTSFNESYGEGFPVPGLRSVNATTQNRLAFHDFVTNTTVGVFGQAQLAHLDRRFLTVGLRADDNSAFGENFDLVYYPKVSGAWVLSEEDFFRLPAISTLRVRAAYGQSGQQPASFAALRTFAPVTGPGDVGTVTPQGVGNPDLGPERSEEIELGFDAGILDNRFGVEFTYYRQNTEDAILLRQIAPSTGFSGSQWVNAGEIRNSGVELLLSANAYESDNLGVDLSFNISTNDNEVVSLGDVTTEDFITGGTYIEHRIGYPVGSWFQRRVVSAERNAAGEIVNVMCEGETGSAVPCGEAPPVFLGRTQPDLQGGFNATVTLFENLRLFGQLDFKQGYRKVDGNLRVRCFFFDLCRENYVPEEYDALRIANIEGGYPSFLINDAGFTKLREVSASYLLPSAWSGRIGSEQLRVTLSGRNLLTWTDYSGLEPEATFHSGGRGGDYTLWEQTVLPQLATFVATVELSF
jgi:TonB-linked SusC/RagA family outer membrane protein